MPDTTRTSYVEPQGRLIGSRFSTSLVDDGLYQLLLAGTADADAQRDAAEWLDALHKERACSSEPPSNG